MTDEEDTDISAYKYHSAQVVALRSGRFAMCGTFVNDGTGIPLVAIFDNLQELHEALIKFQEDSRTLSHEMFIARKTKEPYQLSLESLGLVRPMKRRSLR